MRYIERVQPVEAFMYDGDLINSVGRYYVPKWAEELHKSNRLKYVGQGELIYVDRDYNNINVLVGDYLVRDSQGNITVYSGEEFKEKYEVIYW